MFEAVLERSLPKRPLVASALVALGIHALLIPSAFLLPSRTVGREASRGDVQVTFLHRPLSALLKAPPTEATEAPEALGSVAVGTGARPRVGKPKPLPSVATVATAATPAPHPITDPALSATPPLSTASETHAAAPAAIATQSAQPANGHPMGSGDRSTSAQGTPGGGDGTGAQGSGGGGSGSSAAVLPFGAGMTRPVLLDKRDPTYTREALAARVEGSMLLKCVITTSGSLRACRVIKGLPHMDDAVLRALSEWRYTPVTYQGQPVSVDYVIPVRLVLP